MLSFLYRTVPGRLLLRPLTCRWLSALSGFLMDTRCSALLIRPFVRHYGIDVSEYRMEEVRSFNDFFCRQLREGSRLVDPDPAHLAAPCDGFLSVWTVHEDTVLAVKQSRFTVSDMLHDPDLARRYEGGTCFVFRLCVNHYHRYIYPHNGRRSGVRHISGRFHTVRPVALESVPVFTENTREYILIETKDFGTLVQMEVGALLVGRICNRDDGPMVRKGQEKGMFQYGGSTVILLTEPGRADAAPELLASLQEQPEVQVKMGQCIAYRRQG